MNHKKSVSNRIAQYLFVIIAFASIITTLALSMIASNRSDAEMINIAGSLRMQSYRLLNELQHNPEQVHKLLILYRKSLHASSLQEMEQHILTPQSLKRSYEELISEWRKMERLAYQGDAESYLKEVDNYVNQVDKFVFTLQQFSEKKTLITTLIILGSMLLIVAMVAYVIWFTQQKVVAPLNQLTKASVQVQMRQFRHIPLDVKRNDELGSLAKAFTQMSSELNQLYSNLAEQINEKTQRLTQTNRTLTMLYHCSQALAVADLDRARLLQVLQNVMHTEHLRALEFKVLGAEHWDIFLGEDNPHFTWQEVPIEIEGKMLGSLRWQAGLPCPDPRTLENIAQILGRSLYFNQTQRQQQQLLLMEERSIIARELHDSLAQVLSFLQIQLTLLKHNLNKDETTSKEKSLIIIRDFEQALSDGYIQLRELLATFRLTVQEANLKLALEQVVESLQNQTTSKMSVNCTLPSQTFNPQQLVHALQVVREATLNAIKHAQASHIEIVAQTNADGEQEILVRDDGVGIPSLEEPEGHYGLNIMAERSRQLNATLSIQNRPTGGTEVKILLPNGLV